MCEDGFREKVEGRSLPYPEADYRSRLEHELSVIEGAGLPSYFLIVQDVLAFGKRQGWITGPGRGSSAGCIISWLIDITTIDPLRYGLIFERFYNAGRNAPGRVSLPDIDSDVQKYKREEYYKHLQRTYGPDRVAQIATFASLQGRSALTEVMRANGVNFDVIKRITKVIPDKARITEELQEMKERGEDPSVIAYSLDVYRDELAEWVQVDDEGEIVGGQYAPYFRQAARLEGTKTHIGRHAAGILIGDVPLDQFVPTKWDESAKGNIAAMEYLPALEAMGGCKIDILAVAFLDKAEGVRDLALTGRIGRVA
jgi:DNA polymerase-3 subunit alpha